MKKIFSCILAIIILGAMLSGCSNNGSKEMIKKAKNFSIPHEVSINSTKEDYGILAYNFLHYIQDNYPGLFSKGNSVEIHLECLADSQFCFPLPGGKVISAYGSRGGHLGADIKTKANDSILCVFDGVVRTL